MKSLSLILSFLTFFSFAAFAQSDGDFKSVVSSGDWYDANTWKTYDGAISDWTFIGEVPGEENTVYISENTIVVLDSSAACKDLHIHESALLNLDTATLEVWGQLRFYQGTLPGTETVLPEEAPGTWISSAAEGALRFRGESRTIVAFNSGGTSEGLSGYNLEIAMEKGAEARMDQDFRVGNLTVISGTFSINAPNLFAGNGAGLSGNITIGDSAVFNPPSEKILRTATAPVASFLLDTLATMNIPTSNLIIAAAEIDFEGVVIVEEAVAATEIYLPSNGGMAGAAPVATYHHLKLNGASDKYLSGDIVVNGVLTKTDAGFYKNGFALNYGPESGLEYAGSDAVLTDDDLFPATLGPAHLIISNPNVSLHASRTLVGKLTLNGGILHLGDGVHLTLGADSPPIEGAFSSTNFIALNGTGSLRKVFSEPGSFGFPIGELSGADGNLAFTPAHITVNSADFSPGSFLEVSVKDEKYTNDLSTTSFINRYWVINSTLGDLNLDGTFQYHNDDPSGNEASIMAYIYGGVLRMPISLSKPETKTLSFHNVDINLPSFYVTGSNECNVEEDYIQVVEGDYCGTVDIDLITGSDAETAIPAQNNYVWQQRFNHGQWENISGATERDYDPGVLTVPGFYEFRRQVTTSGCYAPHVSNIFAFTLYPEITNTGINAPGTKEFCVTGTGFDITGLLPEGGDGIFSYQWERSKNEEDYEVVGTNSKDFQETETLDFGTYTYRRGVISPTCGILYSNVVTVEVYDVIQENTIDFITSQYCGIPEEVVLPGSTPEGGSGDYIYKWERRVVGGDGLFHPVGGNTKNLSDNTIPSEGGHFEYRRSVSSFTCDPTYSNVLTISFYPELGPNTIEKAGTSAYCSSASGFEIVGSEMTGGDGAYQFRWERSKDGESFVSLNSDTKNYQQDEVLEPGDYSYRRIVKSVACVDTSEVIKVTVLPPVTSNDLNAPAQEEYCGIPASIAITATTPEGGSGDYTYTWERRIDGGSFVAVGDEMNLIDEGLTVTGAYEYRRMVASGACEPVASDTITITIYPELSENTIASATAYCGEASHVVIEGSPITGGNGNYDYIWERNKDGEGFETVGNEENYTAPATLTPGIYEYRRTVTSALCSSVSEVLRLEVQPPISGNNILAPENQMYCGVSEGFSIEGILPEGGNGNFQYRYERKLDEGAWETVGEGERDFIEGALNVPGTYHYRRIVATDLCTESVSNIITVLVSPPIQLAAVIAETINNENTGAIALEVTGGTPPYTYLWSNSATSQEISNLEGTEYSVVVTDVNNCQASATYAVPRILGLSDSPHIESYQLYPNPVRETLHIQATFLKPLASEVYILNTVGQVVRTLQARVNDQLDLEVDMHSYPAGIYFVKVVADGKAETWKFIKQ